MQQRSKIADGLQLDRRGFIGALAFTGGALASGSLVSGGLASFAAAAPAAAPVAAVFMDMPFVDTTGLHKPYRPPMARYTVAELNPEHHFFV